MNSSTNALAPNCGSAVPDGYFLRGFRPEDMMYLLDIDAKCNDQPWSNETWTEEIYRHTGSVVTYFGTPVGFALFKRYTVKDGCSVELVKLAVKQPYRRQKLGLLLMSGCMRFAQDMACRQVFCVLPESHLYPPDAAILFLGACGFKAVVPMLRDYFDFDGVQQDGVKLLRVLPEGTTCG